MEYQVILKLTDVESAYQEIASGESDIFADAWLPETHKNYMEAHNGKIEKLGIIYPEARTGFVVPEYSNLQMISDLTNYSHPVIGIDEGAGVMQKARLAIEKYSLKNHLNSLSEDEMIKQLEDSIKRRKEIVITGWEPHWIFARYEVRFLDDPDNIFGEKENIFAVGTMGIVEKHPMAVRFFERMQLTENQLNRLVYQVRLSEDPRQGVKNWIDENEYIVNQWVKNLKPERKKIM
jgi:glycine betaine/proline transport system substrate-binding protein